jgi:hypothetical protein
MSAGMPRDLSSDERYVLDVLLSRPFFGRDELREQVGHTRVTGLSCSCGCPSMNLAVDRPVAAAPTSGMVADGVGLDAGGKPVGALLFVDDDGYMSELEIFGWADDTFGMPTVASFKLAEWEDQGGGTHRLKNSPSEKSG